MNRSLKSLLKPKTFHLAWRLGLANCFRVVLHTLAIKTGVYRKLSPIIPAAPAPEFAALPADRLIKTAPESTVRHFRQAADELDRGILCYFAYHPQQMGTPPDWFRNPFNNQKLLNTGHHWATIPDFDPEIGDIKCIWEPSRFHWAILYAQAYRLTGQEKYLNRLNHWLTDWNRANPPNAGPNWKCGQETAIRLLQLLVAAYVLDQHLSPNTGLKQFVIQHCRRISLTRHYALAQNNNHGISEAAALFVGGSWLLAKTTSASPGWREFSQWQRRGVHQLEKLVNRLITPDGSFAQYSQNYHRMVLDMLSNVEIWRREFRFPEFSAAYYRQIIAAVDWLKSMTDRHSGDGPNLGDNDGTQLFNLSLTHYRDHRPTLALAEALFKGLTEADNPQRDAILLWLDNTHSAPPSPAGENMSVIKAQALTASCEADTARGFTRIFPDGGYVVMEAEAAPTIMTRGIVRFPRFSFRPGHADALHFDLWVNGLNLLRDSGSYSYHERESWAAYFASTAAHNTIEFDRRDQMPRMGRFLFSEWLKSETDTTELSPSNYPARLAWRGAYRDSRGCRHQRIVEFSGSSWTITDEISEYNQSAILRWRLAPGDWKLDRQTVIGEDIRIDIQVSPEFSRLELTDGWESRHYFSRTPIPVLEVEVRPHQAIIGTCIHINS